MSNGKGMYEKCLLRFKMVVSLLMMNGFSLFFMVVMCFFRRLYNLIRVKKEIKKHFIVFCDVPFVNTVQQIVLVYSDSYTFRLVYIVRQVSNFVTTTTYQTVDI